MKRATSTHLPAKRKKVVKGTRNWLDLPRDVLILIFIKLGTVHLLSTAQKVCSLWRKISKEPQLFRCVDMRKYVQVFGGINEYLLEYAKMTKEALDRCSIGELVEFSMHTYGTDESVELAIAKSRSRSSLRCLRLINGYYISKGAFINIAAANPMLEEIDLLIFHFNAETIGTVGQSCRHLKSFRMSTLTDVEKLFFHDDDYDLNEDAYAIANNMPGLRHLRILGNKMDEMGLQAILDKCPHLEHLDLRRCYRIDVKGDVLKKCVKKIQNLRLPNESIDDEEFYGCDE